MDEARHILDAYLARTGLRNPADAARQFQVTLLRGWIDHLDEVLDANHVPPQLRLTIVREFLYGTVPAGAEAELRVAMHADMTYWAERAKPDPAVLADLGPPAASAGFPPGCICVISPAPELDGEFGPGSKAESIDVSPACPVHAGQRYSVIRCARCGVVLRSHEPADHTWTPDPAEIAAENARLALAGPGLPPDGRQEAAFDV